jgi:hypothetical protein
MAGKKRRKWPWILGIIALIALVALLLVRCDGQQGDIPTLCIASPQKLAPDTKEFLLDVTVSDLGEALYPAMSMCICFDSSRLEFLGVEEGNLFVLSSENSNGRQLPQWSCDIENSNATGVINVMYLDMTSGKNAFTKALLADDDNVVLRLKLRLRGSCRPGDVLDLILEDAVFAASDEAQSLAMTTGTLKTRNGKLVIGG